MRKNENKVLIILSIGTIISLFLVIRECSYPLIWDTVVLRWLLVSRNNERLISNIAFSYIGAYIFYIMQVYIPKMLNKRNICSILAPKMEEFIFRVSELSFVMEQICYQINGGTFIKQQLFPIYYKITTNDKRHIKKIGTLDTLMEMQRRIDESYNVLLDRFTIYNLDVSILELWEKIPLGYYREIIWISKHNEGKQMSIGVKSVGEENEEIINRLKTLFKIKMDMRFEKFDDLETINKYERVAEQSILSETDLALQLEENLAQKKNEMIEGKALTDILINSIPR